MGYEQPHFFLSLVMALFSLSKHLPLIDKMVRLSILEQSLMNNKICSKERISLPDPASLPAGPLLISRPSVSPSEKVLVRLSI